VELKEKTHTAKIRLLPFAVSVDAVIGESLYSAVVRNRYPLASSCSGDGICGGCGIRVLEGVQNLDPLQREKKTQTGNHETDTDLVRACKVSVQGNVTITTGYW